LGGAEEGTEAEVEEVDDETRGGRDEMEGFPLTWPTVAGTDPKDLTSDLMGGAAEGEEDIGAETSSIDPKVTADPNEMRCLVKTFSTSGIRLNMPCLTAPTLPRGTLTPSFIGTP